MNAIKVNGDDLGIDALQVKKGVMVLRALNHPLRLRILHIIHEKGEISVIGIYSKLNESRVVISAHLTTLRRAGLVTTTRSGQRFYYKVNEDRLDLVRQFVRGVFK